MSIGKSSISRAEKAVGKKNSAENSALFSVGQDDNTKVTVQTKTEKKSSGEKLTAEFINVPVSKIISTYSENSLECSRICSEVIASVAKVGIIEPVVLRKADDVYRIISGHKRVFAAKKLGIDEITAKILEISDEEAASLASELSKFTASSELEKKKNASDKSKQDLPSYLL